MFHLIIIYYIFAIICTTAMYIDIFDIKLHFQAIFIVYKKQMIAFLKLFASFCYKL